MRLPAVLILNGSDSLREFLRKEGFSVIERRRIDDVKEVLLKNEIGTILVNENFSSPLTALYQIILDTSPDTKIIIFGRGSKGVIPYWIYDYLEWPSDDRSSTLEVIKKSLLGYSLIKKYREISEGLYSEKEEKKRTSDKKEILEILRSFSIELNSCRNVTSAIKITKSYVEKIFTPSFFCVILKCEDSFELFIFADEEEKIKEILKNVVISWERLSFTRIRKKDIRQVYINGRPKDIEIEFERPVRSFKNRLILPLIIEKESLGCISVLSYRRRFSPEDIKIFSFIAYQLTNVLFLIRLISQIRDISIKDSLTGIYNRRYFDEILQHEYLRAKRYSLPLSLIMIDIDFFKSINDTFGHLVGDHVLKELAKIIKNSIRQVDIVARFGGEEFAVILPNTRLEEAANIAERLRSIIENTEIRINCQKIRVTISGGVSSLKKDASSKDVLIDQADRALLKAKASGRNKIYAFISEDEITEVRAKGFRERRKFKRISLSLPINYVPLTMHLIRRGKGISKNISEEGICFKDSRQIPKGEFLLAEIDLPFKDEKRKIKVLAQIVWSQKSGKEAIMGAKIFPINPEDREAIRQLIREKESDF